MHLTFPEGLNNFVNSYLDDGVYKRIMKECSTGGKYYDKRYDMRIRYYQYLILHFLNTQFEDQTIYKRVKDMPKEDQRMAVDCLSYHLGMNPRNGNIYLEQIVNKFNMI